MQFTTAKPKTLTDKIIGLDIAAMAAAASQGLLAAANAATDPDLRRLYRDFLQETMSGVEAMQTYIVDKEWAKPNSSPEEQLQFALQDADKMVGAE